MNIIFSFLLALNLVESAETWTDLKHEYNDTPPIILSDYHVGPGQALASISDVPWATLQAGDRVFIHWRSTPYKEKWVINRQGTATDPIQIIGVNGPSGQQPVIDGNGAITASGLNYWNEPRGIIKIGGSNVPADGLPSHIIIDNLEIKSGRPAYQFTDDNGQVQSYVNNAASIYIEKGEYVTIRNCTLHDSGNGIFIGAFNGATRDILLEYNYIYDNGIVGRFFEHNAYTEALGITYQYNRFGPLRAGALGNNLKDRSAGLVLRYNWIESGNRQLDLVDSGTSALLNDPSYDTTLVYGNVLIEPDGAGNSQIIHYGGDSGTTSNYRNGQLYLYNNTIISARTGNTTLTRLSSSGESAQVFNNVIYTSATGDKFAMIDGNGTFNLQHNWLKPGWVDCHCSPLGSVNDLGGNINGTDPGFVDFASQDYALTATSSLINQGMTLPSELLPQHHVSMEYIPHQNSKSRNVSGNLDLGAYEYQSNGGNVSGRVGIGTTTPEGILDVFSPNSGLILPRVDSIGAVTNPVDGMLIYDKSQQCVKAYEGGAWSGCLSL